MGVVLGPLPGALRVPSPPWSPHPPRHPCPPRAGAALGWGLQGRTPTSRPAGFFLAVALALLLGALALHRVLLAAGVDIDW